jgi:capsular polysaccharide export protein
MSSRPSPTKKPLAWACAPGVLKVPNLRSFLPEYELTGRPSRDVLSVVGWGMKPTAAAGRRWAKANNRPYVALEDGFIRSVGLGEKGATSLSLIVDDLGIYYDATRPSRLEQLIQTAPDWCDETMTSRARALGTRIVESRISKTNMGGPLDQALLKPGRRVLIVDQTYGDASIRCGLASEKSFIAMLAAARKDEPDAQLIVKRHPAVAAGKKTGCIPNSSLVGVTLIDTDVTPTDLLDAVDAVYVVTSALGFEALLRGKSVRCFGAPFYCGWGLTTDEVSVDRRGQPRSLEQVVAAALIAYTRYVDPVTGLACTPEQALERLIALRDRADRLKGDWAAVGFAPAKRPPVRRLLNSPKGRVRYFWRSTSALTHARKTGGKLIWWAGKETPQIRAAAGGYEGSVVRMEDGFIRSRGLGSDFFGALSVALDDEGVYYDPTAPSRLESLIEAGGLSPAGQARAEALRARVVASGLSKYNLKGDSTPADWPTDRPILLVVGQVENDRSIQMGCGPDLRTNSALVKAARADFPGAFLIYRNHPDVTAGNRPGLLDAAAMDEVDAVADDLDIVDCLKACDRLATLTSLTGFEALMRGKPVSVYGRPFYAGWGLTDDRMSFERRTRQITLPDLIHAALIDYPLYVTPDGWPCEAEDLVEILIAARDHPLPPAPRGRINRWWRGIKASLDRSPAPAY